MAKATCKLPVWATAKAAYGFVFGHLPMFVRLAGPPMAVYLACYFAIAPFLSQEEMDGNPGLGLAFIEMIFLALFLVAWHRLVLLGPKSIAGHYGLTVGRREFVFFLWMILVFLLVLVVFVLLLVCVVGLDIGYSLYLDEESFIFLDMNEEERFFFVLVLYVIVYPIYAPVLRLAMVLPSVVIDEGSSGRKALAATRGNVFRLASLFFLVESLPIPVVIVVPYAIGYMLGVDPIFGDLTDPVSLSLETLSVIGSFFFGAVYATALALSYRLLTPVQENGEANPGPPAAD